MIILVLGWYAASAQEKVDSLLAKDNVMIPLPTISINVGWTHLMSDVKLSNGPSPFKQLGYQLSITQEAAKFLNVSLDLYAGTVYGDEQRETTNINFRTSIFSQHLNVEYNFHPLLKPNDDGRQLVRPYVGFGVGLISFRTKGDLKNASGSVYNYWTDGTIRSEQEGTVDPGESTILERDFIYETDLRDANIDGLRKYSQLAFSLPINAGVRFQITKNVGVNAAFTYAINFTDLMDNVNESSVGIRAGTKGFDNHLYGSVGLSVFLGRTKPSAKPKRFEDQLADVAEAAPTKDVQSEREVIVSPELTNEATVAETSQENKAISADPPVTNQFPSQVKLAEVADARKDISETRAKIEQELSTINKLKGEIGKDSKLNKEHIEAIKSVIQEMSATLKTVDDLASKSSEKAIDAADNGELTRSRSMERLTEIEVSLSKVDTKSEALVILTKLSNELKPIVPILDAKRSKLVNDEIKLNSLSAVRAKIRLIEKVRLNGANAKSTMSEEELSNSARVLAQELELLKNDTSSILSELKEEITELESRVKTIQDPILASENAPSPNDQTTEDKVAVSKEAASTKDETGKNQKEASSTTDKAKEGTTVKSKRSVEEIENAPPKQSGDFHWADVNNNGWISPDEVLYFIDALFEGESEKTVVDIQNLIDYYFDQE